MKNLQPQPPFLVAEALFKDEQHRKGTKATTKRSVNDAGNSVAHIPTGWRAVSDAAEELLNDDTAGLDAVAKKAIKNLGKLSE